MHRPLIRLPTVAGALLLGLGTGLLSAADEHQTATDARIAAAEEALAAADYGTAVREYRRVAMASDDVEIVRDALRIAYIYGFDADARVLARRWTELEPGSNEALALLGQLQLRTDDYRAARHTFRTLIERSDGAPDDRLYQLLQLLGDDDPATVARLLRDLAKPYRDSALAHYAVAVMALSAGDAETALSRSAKAIKLDPDWLKAKLLHARAQLINGDADAALDTVARLIGDDFDPDPDARLELAVMMMSVDRDDDALGQVNQVLLEQPSRTDALRLMGIINFRQQRFDAAEADFEDLLASGQYTMDALYYLGRIADLADDTERAIRLYSQVRDGGNALSAQRRAIFLLAVRDGEADAALQRAEEFARDNPRHAVDMLLSRARLLASFDRYDEALHWYDRFIEYRPDSEPAMLGRAELLLRMDRLDDALEQYAAAAKRWPDSALSLNAYGYTLTDRTDRHREAEKLIRKAIRLDPDNAAIIDSLGWVLYKRGHYESALVELRRAYRQLDDPEVAAHIVEVLHALGRPDEALAALEAAELKDPESPLLHDVRARLFAVD